MTRRRRVIATVGAVLFIGGAVLVPRLTSRSGSQDPPDGVSLSTATVQRTDLAETTPVEGVIGFGGPGTYGASPQSIVQPGGTAPSVVAQHRQSVASGQQTLATSRQAAADAAAADEQSITRAEQSIATAQAAVDAAAAALQRDRAALAADQQQQRDACQDPGTGSGPTAACGVWDARVAEDRRAVAADEQQVAANSAELASAQSQLRTAELTASQNTNGNQAKVGAAELALAAARAAASSSEATMTSYETTSRYTSLPPVGQVIEPGQGLWSIDGRQTVLVPGTLTPWRAFHSGMEPGPDVAALDQALIVLGYGAGLSVSNEFTGQTARAIERLQAALGEPRTGALALGSVIFEPTAVRVAAVRVQLGAPPAAGATVLDVTSPTPVVDVALPVGQSYLVEVGDPVMVTLPDRTTSPGTISEVGTVAATADPAGGTTNGSSASTPPAATISVTITLARTDGAARLDQAPVTVNITSTTVTGVLAVPTTALVALAGGGYALEVVGRKGTNTLVPITVGIFDDQAGLVEVSGAGVTAGQQVVAPA